MSKNIADTVSSDCRIHVLANETKGGSDRYVEDDVIVHRCWKRGPLYPLQIIYTLYQIDEVNTVHVHHEYDGMYGGILMNAFFPLLLFMFQLSGINVITQPHGVVFNSDVINTQSTSSTIAKVPDTFLEFILFAFNQLLVTLSDTLIVPNRILEQRILEHCFTSKDSLTVIPHGVESRVVDVRDHDPSSGLTLLYFGYITWRKGPDVLASAAQSLPQDWEIILAGGKVPYLSEDPSYQAYYDKVHELASQSENITLTGFVDEENLDTYFKQADLLILPYRTFVAASGVFSLGLRYSLPFLLSEEISSLLQNNDTTTLISEYNINESELTFSIDNAAGELEQRVHSLCMDSGRYEVASQISRDLCERRSWDRLRNIYLELYKRS